MEDGYCIFRGKGSGVHAGTLDVAGSTPLVWRVLNSRRLIRSKSKSPTLSGLGQEGLNTAKLHLCRFAVPVPLIYLSTEDVVEIQLVAPGVEAQIKGVAKWEHTS